MHTIGENWGRSSAQLVFIDVCTQVCLFARTSARARVYVCMHEYICKYLQAYISMHATSTAQFAELPRHQEDLRFPLCRLPQGARSCRSYILVIRRPRRTTVSSLSATATWGFSLQSVKRSASAAAASLARNHAGLCGGICWVSGVCGLTLVPAGYVLKGWWRSSPTKL